MRKKWIPREGWGMWYGEERRGRRSEGRGKKEEGWGLGKAEEGGGKRTEEKA
jgi:hypothetical protein